MNIKYTKGGLAHAYNKHHVTKSRIENSLEDGIIRIVKDNNNDSLIIFTEQLAIVLDYHTEKLKTAFKYNARYFISKCNLNK